MPAYASPWYRKQTHSWYVEIDGKQRSLGKHPEDAPKPRRAKTSGPKKGAWIVPPAIRDAHHALMAAGPAVPSAPAQAAPPNKLTVDELCDRFLAFSETENDKRTYKWYLSYLDDFCEDHGRLAAMEVEPLHVKKWLNAHKGWKTAKRCAITAIKRAFNWSVDEKLIPFSPIKSVKKAKCPSRARTMTMAERAEVLAAIPDWQFRLFVEAMQQSGCRPSEVARVTAADVNLELGVWVFHDHKTDETGKPRVVYLTPRLIEISKELIAKHPTGPLFRGPRWGKPFGMHGICSRFRRLRKKLPHLKNAIAYAYRHSFAIDALTRGVGIAQTAELLGHVDTSMVSRHYGRLADQVAHLREAASKATAA